jgi:hypothetical protein
MACTSHSKKISLNQLRSLYFCRLVGVWALFARKSTHWGARICRTFHATRRLMNGRSSEDVLKALKRQFRLQHYLATDIQVEAPSIQYDHVHFVKFLPISQLSFVLSTPPRSRLFKMPNWEKDAFDDVDFRGIVKERGTPMSLTNNVDIVASKTIILPGLRLRPCATKHGAAKEKCDHLWDVFKVGALWHIFLVRICVAYQATRRISFFCHLVAMKAASLWYFFHFDSPSFFQPFRLALFNSTTHFCR